MYTLFWSILSTEFVVIDKNVTDFIPFAASYTIWLLRVTKDDKVLTTIPIGNFGL